MMAAKNTRDRLPGPEPVRRTIRPGSFHNPYYPVRKTSTITGTCGHGTDFPPRNVLMTDAPPRSDEGVTGMVHPVTEQYGLEAAALSAAAMHGGQSL